MLPIQMILVMGAASAALSITFAKSHLFAGVRSLIIEKCSPMVGKLVSCPWCMGHWFAALVMVLAHLGGVEVLSLPLTVLVVNWLAVVAVSGLTSTLVTGGA